jgi:TolB-like protein/Flp pilus assembly protein TadD
VAVLPFKPISGEGRDEYLNLRQIIVRPTSAVRKYGELEADPVRAGQELKVESVLEGCIQKLGDRFRITARLVAVADGTALWAGRFDERFTDIFDVQDSISERVAAALALKLTGKEREQLTKHYTRNTEAYHLYLKGRYYWNKRAEEALHKAVGCFKQAIDLDPNYALAYAGLADAYTFLGDVGITSISPKEAFSKAKAAAARALELDEALAEAHASLGHLNMHHFEWADAERELARSLELKPNYSVAHQWYSYYLVFTGRAAEALAEIGRALDLDPLSVPITADVGELLFYSRRYDEAIEQFHRAIELDSRYYRAHLYLARLYAQEQMHEKAMAELQKALPLSGNSTETMASLARARALSGDRVEALRLLEELGGLSGRKYVSPYDVALIHAALDDKDAAFQWLDRGYSERAEWMIYAAVDPRLDSLRPDPRYRELLGRMGLAPFWPQTDEQSKKTATRAIAVLPFKPISPEGRDEYLELGIADALITKLSNLSRVVVRPTSSVRKYAGLEQDSVAAGGELMVEWVLEGNIQKLDDRIRVTARLVKVAGGRSVWADKFDEKLTDIFAVEDSISERVAAALALKLTGEERERLTKRHTENIEAYQAYLKGRFFWNKRTTRWLKKSVQYFEQAIDLDPDYALAHVGLADSYTLLVTWEALTPEDGFSKAKRAARIALEIDDTLGEAHAGLAHTLLHTWEWERAEQSFKRAIDLNPGYATAHQWYSEYLAAVGAFDKSVAEINRALELDPVSVNINADVGKMLYFARRYDEAIEQLKQTIEMEPGFWSPRHLLGQAYTQKGMYEEAIAESQKAMEFSGKGNLSVILVGHAYAASGNRSEALAVLDRLKELSKERYFSPYRVALIYAGLGHGDEMFQWLDRAYEKRDANLIWLKVDPILDRYRSDSRFADLSHRVGFKP